MIEKITALFGAPKKRFVILAVLLIIGVVLLRWDSDCADTQLSEVYESEGIEEKIKDFLKTVSGIDEVNVYVTVDGGYEYEYAEMGDEVSRTVYPKIRGVAISCTGGDDPLVQQKIVGLLSSGLGIGSNRIQVAGNR